MYADSKKVIAQTDHRMIVKRKARKEKLISDKLLAAYSMTQPTREHADQYDAQLHYQGTMADPGLSILCFT